MRYIKSFKFWIVFLFFSYSLIGFLVIPWFITSKLPHLLTQKSGINLEIKKAFFNPFNFELTLKEVTLFDLDKKAVLNFEKLFLNYSLMALLDKTILFDELTISSPKLFTTLKEDGSLNLQNILPKTQESKAEDTKEQKTSLPKIILRKVQLENGAISFYDVSKQFSMDLGPYDFMIHDLSSQEGSITSHTFTTKLQETGSLRWEGGFSLNPLQFYGTLELQELQLPKLFRYSLHEFPSHLAHGKISLILPYQIEFQKGFEAKITDAFVNLKALTLKHDNLSILDISNIDVNGINISYPNQQATVKSIFIKRPTVVTVFDKQLNLLKAFSLPNTKEQTPTKESKPWSFRVEKLTSEDTKIKLFEKSTGKESYFEFANMQIALENISSNTQEPIYYSLSSKINEVSSFNLLGEVIQEPLHVKSKIDLKNLQLRFFENYFLPYANIYLKTGAINLNAQADINQNSTSLIADTFVDNLAINTLDNEPLLSWKQFALKDIHFEQNPMQIDIGSLALINPFAKLRIEKDGSTNFSNLVKLPQTKEEKKESSQNPHLKVGSFLVQNARANFSDLSLPFPFQTNIHSLNGTFSTLDMQKAAPSNIKLEGKIDKYGYTKITGALTPLALKEFADIDVTLKNLDLTSITPYSGKFVGYKIDTGKLSMDLNYKIDKASLKGANKINIDTLTLGEKVQSPEAINLPLGLAIALLKDSNGQIDIDLPVAGDMNNPEFSYGGVIWRAVGNLITGIVTAPFKFLGNMLGIDGEKLKSIDFALGGEELIITEYEKLANLEKIMGKRPNIKLSITGSFDKQLDTKALQEIAFKKILDETQKSLHVKDKKTDIYALSLKQLYVKDFGEDAYEKLQKSFFDEKADKVDIASLNKHITQTLSERLQIPREALLNLAMQRAKEVQNALHVKHHIGLERLLLQEVISNNAKREEWVEVKLDITN